MTHDYNEHLHMDYASIRDKVERGVLTIGDRIKAIDDAVKRYVCAQDDDFEGKRIKAETQGRSVNTVPIQYRNTALLDALANLLMYEYLTWSHHDKMNIVDNPILSDTQMAYRHRKESRISDVYTGGEGDASIGRRTDHDGVKRRIYDYMTPERDMSLIPSAYIDLYDALDNAGLTERQRQAIELVYFEGMTQEDAAEEMGVSKPAVNQFISFGNTKIKKYLTLLT